MAPPRMESNLWISLCAIKTLINMEVKVAPLELGGGALRNRSDKMMVQSCLNRRWKRTLRFDRAQRRGQNAEGGLKR